MSLHGSEVVCLATSRTAKGAKDMVLCMLDGHGLNSYDRSYYMSHGSMSHDESTGRYTFSTTAMVHSS